MGLERLPHTIELAPDGRTVRIVDQTRLPRELVIDEITDWHRLVDAVKTLEVRGAPALGIAGAAALALFAATCPATAPDAFERELAACADIVASARPTAVNLSWGARTAERAAREALTQTGSVEEARRALVRTTCELRDADEASCRAIGHAGSALLPRPARILTHCNAGSLACAFFGTALGVVYEGFEQGIVEHVFADETRPVGQGARLTAWELGRVGVPTTLICDDMAASLMAQGKINAVVVGADRICANGDAANKIGTYGVAVLAHYHHIPFYIAAPLSTIDWDCAHGSAIPIEERAAAEVADCIPEGVDVYNPAFDVTPAALITAIITEEGAVAPADLASLRN